VLHALGARATAVSLAPEESRYAQALALNRINRRPRAMQSLRDTLRDTLRHHGACRSRFREIRTKVLALEVRVSGEWGSNQGECQPRCNWLFSSVFAFRTKLAKSAVRRKSAAG